MTAAVSAAGTTPKVTVKATNPYDIGRELGFESVFVIASKPAGVLVTRRNNAELNADQIAKLPTLIDALAKTQIGLQATSRALLESLLPVDIKTAGTDTVTNLLATSGTDSEIVIPPAISPTAVAVGSTDQPAVPFPKRGGSSALLVTVAATTGGAGRKRVLPTSTDRTANRAIEIFYRELNSPGITFEIINNALVITPEGDSSILDGSLSEMFEAAISAVEEELKLKVDRKFISIDSDDDSIRIEKPKAS